MTVTLAERAYGQELAAGQVWRRKGKGQRLGETRITIERVARRTVLGPMTISMIHLTCRGQVRHRALLRDWERVS